MLNSNEKTIKSIRAVTIDLLSYCNKENWAGWDPYDALNSRLFKLLPFLNFSIPRLVLIQLLKRSPINLRKPLLIPKTRNPKAVALFLSALTKLAALRIKRADLVANLINIIERLRSSDDNFFCWGYSFPWQTRDRLVPKSAPNLVCTTFVANSLLDAYESQGDPRCLHMAVSAAAYIVNKLYYSENASVSSYSYPTPDSRIRVHNANFLGAAFLCRVYKHSGDKKLLENALKVIRYSVSKQKDDGSWNYGEHSNQRWIDNFHTGYNLCALRDIKTYTGIEEFEPHVEKGFKFYVKHFFRKNGAPKYFYNRDYPLDIHCVAQSIITLMKFKSLDDNSQAMALSVYRWSLNNLRSDQGYFYYQKTQYYRNKISYVRWSQAWMLYALAVLLDEFTTVNNS